MPPQKGRKKMYWWQKNAGRLLKEREVMGKAFPAARLVKCASGSLAWDVPIRSNFGALYRVSIVYPENFPASYPLAYVVEPKIKQGTPHIYSDNHLCLFNQSDRPEKSYTSKTTAATISSWVAAWVFSYEVWTRTGKWPERRV